MLSFYQFIQLCKNNNIYSAVVCMDLLSGKEYALLSNHATIDNIYVDGTEIVWDMSLDVFYDGVVEGVFEIDIDKLVKKYKLKPPSKL